MFELVVSQVQTLAVKPCRGVWVSLGGLLRLLVCLVVLLLHLVILLLHLVALFRGVRALVCHIAPSLLHVCCACAGSVRRPKADRVSGRIADTSMTRLRARTRRGRGW